MKKSFAIVVFVGAVFNSTAGIFVSDSVALSYQVVSDQYAPELPPGKCRVVGRVMTAQTDTAALKPLMDAYVGTTVWEKKTVTDSAGNYALLIDEDDSLVFFAMIGYNEVVVRNYDFKSQQEVRINFFATPRIYYLNVVDKPVIYLYSENEINAEIVLSCIGDLTFTYPFYNGSWNVSVNENGIADLSSGVSCPYLFWESETTNLQFESGNGGISGVVMNTDSTVSFLENSLTAMGLSPTEQTDFITFWAPKMIEDDYVFVQFLVDDAYTEHISTLTISPQPDAIRRVFMLYAPIQLNDPRLNHLTPPQIPEYQHLLIKESMNPSIKFERKGFTVVEWGGSRIQLPPLNP